MATDIATFGAGCFWGVEQEFRRIPGVTDVAVGFMGGDVEDPSYEQVCTGKTGHAEVAQVEYDPEKVSYADLLDAFFRMHDPTQVDRQGPDVGSQYRSAIFYHSPEHREMAQRERKAQEAQRGEEIATVIEPAGPFYRAEEYHQRYLEKRGGGAACHA